MKGEKLAIARDRVITIVDTAISLLEKKYLSGLKE